MGVLFAKLNDSSFPSCDAIHSEHKQEIEKEEDILISELTLDSSFSRDCTFAKIFSSKSTLSQYHLQTTSKNIDPLSSTYSPQKKNLIKR